MSVDERLIRHASQSSNNTPHSSNAKTFDYPESFSMSSWSQHTISQDVFRHQNAHQGDNSINNEV